MPTVSGHWRNSAACSKCRQRLSSIEPIHRKPSKSEEEHRVAEELFSIRHKNGIRKSALSDPFGSRARRYSKMSVLQISSFDFKQQTILQHSVWPPSLLRWKLLSNTCNAHRFQLLHKNLLDVFLVRKHNTHYLKLEHFLIFSPWLSICNSHLRIQVIPSQRSLRNPRFSHVKWQEATSITEPPR